MVLTSHSNDDARRSIDLYCSLIKETINNVKEAPKNEERKIDDNSKIGRLKKIVIKPKMPILKKLKTKILSGAGFKDCNSALDESRDIEKAVEILRIKVFQSLKKMSRT